MGRGKEGQGEERGYLQRPRGHGGTPVGTADVFVMRFSQELEAISARRILDAGCGSGRSSAYLASLGFQVVALDLVPSKVREARDNAPQDVDLCFVSGRLESLPFSSANFDALICTHVMEYLDGPRIRAALGEFSRVLRKGGLLLLVTASKEGASLDAAEKIRENHYLFRRGGIEVPIHLTDRAELEGWLQGFRIREILQLSLEYPRAATVNASWAVTASVRGENR